MAAHIYLYACYKKNPNPKYMWIFNKYWSWVKEQVIPPDDHPDSGRTLIFDLSNFRRQWTCTVYVKIRVCVEMGCMAEVCAVLVCSYRWCAAKLGMIITFENCCHTQRFNVRPHLLSTDTFLSLTSPPAFESFPQSHSCTPTAAFSRTRSTWIRLNTAHSILNLRALFHTFLNPRDWGVMMTHPFPRRRLSRWRISRKSTQKAVEFPPTVDTAALTPSVCWN